MTGIGFAYVVMSDNQHILLNRPEPMDNELLNNGLFIVVEEGVESA